MADPKRSVPKPFDAEAVNPRYKGAKMSDVARALTRPRNPQARAALARLQGPEETDDGHDPTDCGGMEP